MSLNYKKNHFIFKYEVHATYTSLVYNSSIHYISQKPHNPSMFEKP